MILDYIFDEKEDDSLSPDEKVNKRKTSITANLKENPDAVIQRYMTEADYVIYKYEKSNNLKDKLDTLKRAIFLISLGLTIINAVLTFFSFGITNKFYGILRTSLFGLIAKIFSKPDVALLKKSSYYRKDLLLAYNKLLILRESKKIPDKYKIEVNENIATLKAYIDDIDMEEGIHSEADLTEKNKATVIDSIYNNYYR